MGSRPSVPISLRVYRAITYGAGPLVGGHLSRRIERGKEDPNRIRERYGEAKLKKPAGRLVWLHAASIGESISVLPLIARLTEHPDVTVLVTSGTTTSANLMADRLPAGRAIHQYVPLDHPKFVSKFLDHWKPDMAIWVESELWPNLIHATATQNIPCLLVNARMSARSARNWSYLRGMSRYLLGSFVRCLAQDEATGTRLVNLGARSVEVVGNLKLASPTLPFDDIERARLDLEIAGRPVWVAASTHPGEDEIVLEAHRQVSSEIPDVLTIIVPRHPERGKAIADLVGSTEITVAQRSKQDSLDLRTSIYLADTLGELGLIYGLSKVAFVGGSLVPHGGQNPLEPARCDCAILVGPYTDNFSVVIEDLKTDGAVDVVSDAASLARTVITLLTDENTRQERAQKALKIATVATKVQDLVVLEVEHLLPGNSSGGDGEP